MIEQFYEAIRSCGLNPPGQIVPGEFHRFPGVGKSIGNTAGWCKLFPDGLGGIFGDHSTELSESWLAGQERPWTKAEREAFRQHVNAARRQAEDARLKDQLAAAIKARNRWKAASKEKRDHQYLIEKHIKPHGTRLESDNLLIPLRDETDQIWALQTIGQDGGKLFSPSGCRTKSLYFGIGDKPEQGKPVIITEGFATGAAIHEATGHRVFCAMTAGNLEAVAKIIKIILPDNPIVLCADDDQRNDRGDNVGIDAATKAALAVGGVVALPNLGKKADFWNLWNEQGADAVRAAIEAATLPATTRSTATTGEDRQCEWPEPLPLFIAEDSKPYPIEALPIILRHAVQEVVDFVQCPTPLAACSALSVASLVAQSLVDVQRAESLSGPSSLYLLALAESGERKSTVDGHFSAPIREWEREQVERLKPLATKHNANMEAWQAEKAGLVIGIKDAMKGGRDTSDLKERMVQLEENKPTPPRVPRMLFSDSTPEALATRLASSYPTGAVLSAEAGTVLGGHAMKNDSAMRNMALLNALWSGEQITVDRKAEGGSFILRGARLTMGLAVQPATIRQFIDQQKGLARGIGWLARFLVAWPESTQGQRFFRDAPSTWPSLSALHRRLANLLDHPLNFNDEGQLSPAVVNLSPDAKAVWCRFHDDVETELRPGREMAECRDVASKAADNAARLAAIFHVLENGPVGQVSADNMRSAARLAGWHLYEARRFLGEMAAPVHVNHARRLDDWLLERCRGGKITLIPTRDILREGPSCVRCSSALDAAIEELTDAGRARLHKDGRRRFVAVNPALLSEV